MGGGLVQLRRLNAKSRISLGAARSLPEFEWAKQGCLRLIAARKGLGDAHGRWNEKSIASVSFVNPAPNVGYKLIIGFPMPFRYRKTTRTL